MRRYLMEMKPTKLDHVIAMIALFRPGPIEHIPNYIQRMHGLQEVEYKHPALEPILCEHHGILVYQEQLMRAVIEMAGFTPSEADDLRKAVSKKNADAIQKNRAKFIEGAGRVVKISAAQAAEIFDDWEGFARYGFNKAHAADYGVICAQTAYLKAHYPVEFMTALLSVSKNEIEKVGFYIADCRKMGIDVLPPDICSSEWDFTIEQRPQGGYAIRYGLGAVKNVGEGAVNEILVQRERNGLFATLDDLAGRVDLRRVGKRALESLVKVGALDSLGERTAILDTLDCILSVSASQSRAKEAGQISLFSASPCGPMATITLAASQPVPRRTMLAWEKELLGLYVSDHPLSTYREELEDIVTHWSAALSEAPNQSKVRVAGMVSHLRAFQSRNGKPMAFVTIEDLQGSIELIIFPSVWEKASSFIKEDVVLVAEGKAESGNTPRVLVDFGHCRPEESSEEGCQIRPSRRPSARSRCADCSAGSRRCRLVSAAGGPGRGPFDDDCAAAGCGGGSGANPAGSGIVVTGPAGTDSRTELPVAAASLPDMELRPSAVAMGTAVPGVDIHPIAPVTAADPPPIAPRAGLLPGAAPAKIDGPRLILLYIRETGDRARDTRRLRILYGLLPPIREPTTSPSTFPKPNALTGLNSRPTPLPGRPIWSARFCIWSVQDVSRSSRSPCSEKPEDRGLLLRRRNRSH